MSRALFTPLFLPTVPSTDVRNLRLVVAVEMNFVVLAVGGVALLEFVDNVRFAGDGAKRRNPIVVAHDLVG